MTNKYVYIHVDPRIGPQPVILKKYTCPDLDTAIGIADAFCGHLHGYIYVFNADTFPAAHVYFVRLDAEQA